MRSATQHALIGLKGLLRLLTTQGPAEHRAAEVASALRREPPEGDFRDAVGARAPLHAVGDGRAEVQHAAGRGAARQRGQELLRESERRDDVRLERRAELVDVDAPDDARRARGRVVHEERERGLGSTRVIQVRFNMSVSRARVTRKTSTRRDRSER